MLIDRHGAVQMVKDGKCDLQNTYTKFDFKKYAKISIINKVVLNLSTPCYLGPRWLQ